jgi:TolB-like protein/Tfp pilus assembly protein PilF
MAAPTGSSPDRLDSWKEIAAYLGREVRTVQGWEKNEGLPVHRLQHSRQGSVYAFKSELDAWREARKGAGQAEADAQPQEAAVPEPDERRGLKWSPVWIGGAAIAILAVAGVVFWAVSHRLTSGDRPSSVVVLPFLDLSPQKDQEYFSDGLTEEIIDALSRVPNVRVVARTSAFAIKGKAVDVRQIGHQLSVDAVLEGSVRKSGDQLRITAQLNRVSDGTHLWSRTFDRQLRDIFAVQREISQAIANQLRAGPVPQRTPTSNLQAYDLFQEGRYFFNQHIPPDSYNKAIERYQRAIELDPNFALAYAGLADANAYLAENMVVAPRLVMPKAKEAAERAVALDGNLGEAHTSLGIVKMDYEWDRDGAQAEFLKAMQLSPSSGWTRHWYAHSLESQGRVEDALKEMRAALQLDPLSLAIYWDIANELYWLGRYQEQLQHLAKANEMFPNTPLLLFFTAWGQAAVHDAAALHRTREALRAAAEASGFSHSAQYAGMMGWISAAEGRRDETQRTLADLERLRSSEYVDAIMPMMICSELKDSDCFVRWSKRAVEDRSVMVVYARVWRKMYAGMPQVESILTSAR